MRRMSMWYRVDGVVILKDSVCPTFTLIDVAKPWIVESPAPLTCQSLAGSPVSWFSHATGLPHAAAAGGAADRATALANATTSATTASIAILRLEAGMPMT